MKLVAKLLIGVVAVAAWPAPSPAAPANPVVDVAGSLATADRIAVIVPGVGTTAENFDRGLGGVLRRSPSWQAEQLLAACGGRTAVVAWLGYHPPDGIDLAAVRSDRAVAGARALARYVAEVAKQRPGADITLIGHSYGSLVLAYAAPRLPAQVTDLVALGSPGLDVGRAGQLRTHAELWIGSAESDWTRWLPDVRILGLGHGTNPSRPWFGGQRLNVDGAAGHDGYFVPGTTSLRSLAAVVTQ